MLKKVLLRSLYWNINGFTKLVNLRLTKLEIKMLEIWFSILTAILVVDLTKSWNRHCPTIKFWRSSEVLMKTSSTKTKLENMNEFQISYHGRFKFDCKILFFSYPLREKIAIHTKDEIELLSSLFIHKIEHFHHFQIGPWLYGSLLFTGANRNYKKMIRPTP